MSRAARAILLISLICQNLVSLSQNRTATVSGFVVDENDQPIPGASVSILGQSRGTLCNDSGYFRIETVANRAFALIFSHTGHRPEQRNFFLNEGEQETVTI